MMVQLSNFLLYRVNVDLKLVQCSFTCLIPWRIIPSYLRNCLSYQWASDRAKSFRRKCCSISHKSVIMSAGSRGRCLFKLK